MRITKSVFTLSDFISWQKAGELVTTPKFQRRAVWSPSSKSYLVDTVVKDLPVPIVILRKVFDSKTYREKREVVDGQQRLRTLLGFVDSNLLPDYDEARDHFKIRKIHNAELAGKRFADLTDDLKLAILNYEFSVHTLPSGTTDREVLEIFSRLNSTGVGLKDQELRNAKFTGAFKSLVYDIGLENLERWRTWGVFNENEIARMDEAEMTSDVIMLMIRGLDGKKQWAINKFYEEHDEAFEPAEVVYERFGKVMERIETTIGSLIPESQLARKTIFPLVFAFYYDLMYGLGTPMNHASPNDTPHVREAMETAGAALKADQGLPDVVSKALRGSTNSLVSRQGLLDFLRATHDAARP